MHSNKTRNQFMQLRAQGWSLARISAHIGVSKNTLIDWNRIYEEEIDALCALEREAIHEQIRNSYQTDLDRLANLH